MIIIKVKTSEYEHTYRGNISIRIDDVFVHISSNGYTNDDKLKYTWDYNIHDKFFTEEVESIKGLDNDQ